MAHIYLPGAGMVDLDVWKVNQAVAEYDERLSFRLNEQTGDYCCFVKTPRPHSEWNPPEVPVLGFGRTVPTVEEALKRLYIADTKRHGTQILRDIDRRNAERQKEKTRAYNEALTETAEAVEYGMRKDGQTPYIKSVRPKVKE